jgi:excisionase family DNA binding protein
MEKLTLSVNEFCEAVDIGRTKAYEMFAAGELEIVRLGRRTLITKRSVDALIERLACPSSMQSSFVLPRD